MKLNCDEKEVLEILQGDHGNPHNILGMHKIENENKGYITVRCFYPNVDKIYIIDSKSSKKFLMDKIFQEGFYQIEFLKRTNFFKYKFEVHNYDGSFFELYDPYCNLPQIQDVDIHLFNEGTNYEIYNVLGANYKVVNGVEGIVFGVWAPNAKRVSVIGDFNNWNGLINPMRVLGESGVWELFVPELKNFDRYKFEIKTSKNILLEKSDPYERFQELRPSKASLIFHEDYKWKDGTWLESREQNNPLDGPVNIYEVHLGSWKRSETNIEGFLTYKELAKELVPYVKKMGYTHIELMPITEYPFDGSWGYQVTGYFAVTSRYGTPTEFKEFVDSCHKNGIGVILDWVPAHFPKDSNGLEYFDGSKLYEHEDPRLGEHSQWGTLIFNYGRSEVKNFLVASALFWIEEFHIDGIRVDAVASMLYLDYCKEGQDYPRNKYGGRENLEAVEFIKHMNSMVAKRNANVLMIAEESTEWPKVTKPVEDGGLGFNLKWNMGWMNDFLSYIEEDYINRKYHHNKLTFGMMYAYTENFVLVLSHDEVVHGKKSLIDKASGDIWRKCANLKASLGYMYGHPGKKLLFMGGEFGHFREWDEKISLDWFLLEYEHHLGIQKFVKDLNKLYKKEPAFWQGDFESSGFSWLDCDNAEQSILTFARYSSKKNETLVFIINFTPETYFDYNVKVPFKGTFKELINSDNQNYFGSGVTNPEKVKSFEDEYENNFINIKVPPLGVSIFKVTR